MTPIWRRPCTRARKPKPQAKKSPPDFAAVHEQLRSHRHVTMQLLWEEYREANPDGYRYSRFCELYQRWRKKLDVVMRQEHKAGRESFHRLGRLDDLHLRPCHRRGVASLAVRRRPRRQFLHLGRSHSRPADGSLAARAHPRFRLLGRRSGAGRSRQYQDGRDQSSPLRSGCQPDLLQLRRALRLRRTAGAAVQTEGQSGRGKCRASCPTLDHRGTCVIASSSRWKKPTRRLASCSTGSTTGPSANGMAAGRASSNRSTNPL